ncbi:MAG: hypothetical protein CR988_02920 [Treponema sp.]|nr:MAG: hypothetical protein CR988_02920 [Treponema sp.]
MNKRLLAVLFFLYIGFNIYALGSDMLEVTKKEKDAGWEVRPDIGVKYQKPVFFNKYKTKIAFRENSSGVYNKKSLVYKRIDCVFFTDYLVDRFFEFVVKSKTAGKKTPKLFEAMVKNKSPVIYSITIVRSRKFKKKYIKKITGMKFNYILASDRAYTHIFSTTDVNTGRFTEKEKIIFDDIVSQLEEFKNSMQVCKPCTVEQAVKKIKRLKFEGLDLSGRKISDSYFKKSRVTMIYYWDSTEPICRIRLAQLAKLDRKYPNSILNQVGIVSNITGSDESAGKNTEKYLKNIKCKFINIKNNSDFSSFSKYLLKPSLLFFVDSKGRILKPVITKHLTERQLESVIQDVLSQVKVIK